MKVLPSWLKVMFRSSFTRPCGAKTDAEVPRDQAEKGMLPVLQATGPLLPALPTLQSFVKCVQLAWPLSLSS